ncbi:unnamed protein product [Mytilus coruscus]|uniref:Uncharacterized protein n=1 Tax=Mytilus coruscus TaxID=42192 RepID=A0A6J8DAD9_MYTCO|nr:unnamed protein product [Mytilus coruscus]
MGYEGRNSRKKFVDVRIVRSKTGHAILKGCSFYNLTLDRDLRRLSKDVIDKINTINYRMRLLTLQSANRMKRSEKLVKTFDLPPLKAKQVPIASVGKDSKKIADATSPKQSDTRKGYNHLLGLRQDMRSASPTDGRDYRKMFYSPAPRSDNDFEDENGDQSVILIEEQSGNFPHIKVENCDEKLPPVGKPVQGLPEYAQKKPERSASSNSLEVPSPMIKRRSQDGKCVTVLTSNMQSNFSRSESSIVDAIQQDDDDSFEKKEQIQL